MRPETRVFSRKVAIAFILLLSPGCATLVHGTSQTIAVVSDPPGARVSVDSVNTGVTPLLIPLRREHSYLLTLTHDGAAAIDVRVARSISPWIVGNSILYGVPALVDFMNGAAFQLSPDTVRVVFPKSVVAGVTGTSVWGLARGDRVRFSTRADTTVLQESAVDSASAETLYVHEAVVTSKASANGIPIKDLPRLDIYQAPNYKRSAERALHKTGIVTGGLLLVSVPAGEILILAGLVSLVALPSSYVLGGAAAKPRWAPLEARRMGSPLLIDDQVSVTTKETSLSAIRGRLLNIDAHDLVLSTTQGPLRVPRSQIATLRRVDGYDFGKGVVYGVVVGALAFGAAIALSEPRYRHAALFLGTVTGGFIGLHFAPGLAPRRWVDVHSW